MAEKMLPLAAVLFLLSMICERIADFLKHYLCGSKLFGIKDTLTKYPQDTLKEKARDFRILKINVWCGIIVATLFKADMIMIFNHMDDPGKTLGWSWDIFSTFYKNKYDLILMIPGIILTGCFISFGSKFWHDLLDILYQIKNTRRVLNDPEMHKVDNVDDLQKIISTYQSDFIKAAFEEARSKLMLNDNVSAVALKKDTRGSYYFEVKIKQRDATIEPTYVYVLSDGTPQSVTVKTLIVNDEIQAHSIDLGSEIYEMRSSGKKGTLGCIVKPLDSNDSRRYILTCCHNVVHPASNAEFVQPGQLKVGTSDLESNPIGTIYKAVRNHEIDAALIEIDPLKFNTIMNSIPEIDEPKNVRPLTDSDIGLAVNLYGANTGYHEGKVTSITANAKIKYSTDSFEILNMIAVENNGVSVSDKGDSGCAVVDSNNAVVGLIVGGDSYTSYIIPIEKMLTKFKVQLINSNL